MRSEQIIRELIKQGEGQQLEFKEQLRQETVGKTICAFLNNDGGQVLIGIKDNGTVTGIVSAEKKAEELQQYLLKEIVPEAPITISVETFNRKKLILAKVWAGSKKPYVFSSTIFFRRNDATVQASTKEISELISRRQEIETHWERQIASGVELEDLDVQEIKKTIEAAITNGRTNESEKDIGPFLNSYGLYLNGQFTNAAVVLFAKEPAKHLPQCRTRLAFLPGGKTAASFKYDMQLEDNLFKNIDAVFDFFRKNLFQQSRFVKNQLQRTDEYIYPLDALREGVLNSFVHRDYSKASSASSIILYADKLEIINSGKLPLTPGELTRNHLSMPFNPDIAQMVFLRGYIEKIGRGTLKIIEACRLAKLKPPQWVQETNTVKLSFFSNTKLKGVTKGVIKGVKGSANMKKIEGVIEGVTEGVTEGVKSKLSNLLAAIASNEGKKIPVYADIVGVPQKTIENYIKQLRDAGLIEFKGAPRTGGYIISEKTKRKIK